MATTTENDGNGATGKAAKKAGKHAKTPQPPQLSPEKELRVRRESLGLSRARVADEAEVAVSAVWRAEHEEAGVDDETRERIVDVLNTHRNNIAKLPPLL